MSIESTKGEEEWIMELIPIVDFDTLELKGFAERKWVERNRLCHLTALLIPVRCEDGKVVLQIRPEGKSYAGCRDFFGGHVTLGKEFWAFLVGQEFDLKPIVWSTAMREANEELRMTREDGYPEIITKEHLTIIENIGSFPWIGKQTVERSTLFIVKIPHNCLIHPMDDVNGKFVPVKTEFLILDEVLEKYRKNEWKFADGAERILKRLSENKELLESVRGIITTIQ